jgi:hypothetical protein
LCKAHDVERFEWTGDLADDCFCTWRGMAAHAERLGASEWYCMVERNDACLGDRRRTENTLFHSSATDDILPLTGPAARRLCEMVMRLAYIDFVKAELREERIDAEYRDAVRGMTTKGKGE